MADECVAADIGNALGSAGEYAGFSYLSADNQWDFPLCGHPHNSQRAQQAAHFGDTQVYDKGFRPMFYGRKVGLAEKAFI